MKLHNLQMLKALANLIVIFPQSSSICYRTLEDNCGYMSIPDTTENS